MKQKEMTEQQAAAPVQSQKFVQDQSTEELISTLGANH